MENQTLSEKARFDAKIPKAQKQLFRLCWCYHYWRSEHFKTGTEKMLTDPVWRRNPYPPHRSQPHPSPWEGVLATT